MRCFYGYDGHGSVRFLTNTSASITDIYEYDAFGNLIASTGSTPNNYLFSGEQFDPALGMYQMRARWYRQVTGRFVTRDPEEGHCCTPLSWNPYVYAYDDPVNQIDPSGRGLIDQASLIATVSYQLVLVPAAEATLASLPFALELTPEIITIYCWEAGVVSLIGRKVAPGESPPLPDAFVIACLSNQAFKWIRPLF